MPDSCHVQTADGHRRYLTLRNCRPDGRSWAAGARRLLSRLAAAAGLYMPTLQWARAAPRRFEHT